jgi:hypothetical protein
MRFNFDTSNKIKNFLIKEWVNHQGIVNFNPIVDLLSEEADVLTITFYLQHIRTKILKMPENFEFDCSVAGRVIEVAKSAYETQNKIEKNQFLKALEKFKKESGIDDYDVKINVGDKFKWYHDPYDVNKDYIHHPDFVNRKFKL